MLKHGRLFKSIISIALILGLTLPGSAMALPAAYGAAPNGGPGISTGVTDEQNNSGVLEGAEGKCTQFYMGRDTTENGSYIWGRSEDMTAMFAKLFAVHPAADHKPGEMYISGENDFTWPYPAHTLRYIMCKDSDAANGPYKTDEAYAEVGMNERNVAVSASVSVNSPKKEISDADAQEDTALAETDIVSIVLMQAETARQGCEILANIYDTVGAAGSDGIMISDPNEVWFFQSLAGHQYVAVKCPDDKIGFSPNTTGNVGGADAYTVIGDTNVIASPNLISLPKSLGLLVGDDNKIKIADTYASNPSNHKAGRLLLGHYYLKGADDASAQPDSAYMDYFLEPRDGQKYSLYEAMRLLGYRGEGSPYEVADPKNNRISIGNNNTLEAHVFEVRPGMIDALATVEWLCMGPAEFSVYLPYYGSLITDTSKKYYEPDADSYNSAETDANTAYWVFRELYKECAATTAEERSRLGDGVRDFWERYQKSLIEQQASVDTYMQKIYKTSPQTAEEKATEISIKLSEETYEYAKQILAELKEFKAAGTDGDFVPSALLDKDALPHYAQAEPTPTPTHRSHSSGSTVQDTITTTTTENSDGSITTTTTNLTTGTVTEVTKYLNGSQLFVETRKGGSVTTEVTLSSKAVEEKQGGAVPLPMPKVSAAKDRGSAPVITINGPGNTAVKVEIPIKNATAGTVVILVHGDGTEEILKNAITSENGLIITVNGTATVKIVDNSKEFSDVSRSSWAFEAVTFAAGRELFSGTGSAAFSPNADMTRSMLVTVLARLDGQNTAGGETWYSKAAEWAKKNGVSDGSDPNGAITREQLAAMLYRYARNGGMDAVQNGMKVQNFSDYESISGYSAEAMAWCVNLGLISGMGDNTLNPQGNASRAQVAAILQRFIENVPK